MKNADQSAYPYQHDDRTFKGQSFEGLTKREAFAMAAMQGICSQHPGEDLPYHVNGGWLHPETVAKHAIDIADELLKQLEK